MDSRVLRAGAAHKNALDFTERGMLRKDDLFKVVFDPGSDKREERILGPVFSLGEDTGGVRFAKFSSDRPTRLLDCSAGIDRGQRGGSRRMQVIPVAIGLRGRSSSRRQRDHAGQGREIRQGIDLLPAGRADHRAPPQEEWHIGAGFRGYAQALWWGKTASELVLESNERGDGIGRARAQATLHRQLLIDVD